MPPFDVRFEGGNESPWIAKRVRLLPIAIVPMVTLATLVVVANDALVIDHVGQPVLETMGAGWER